MKNIIPLLPHLGTGFTSPEKLTDPQGYSYQPLKGFHNYHFTPKNWAWPTNYPTQIPKVIDGFSPNLNKTLHCGHLKNLAVATALANLLEGKPVAMLGASLGVHEEALEAYHTWCKLAGYNPTIYFDTELSEPKVTFTQGTGEFEGCQMFGEIVAVKSNGTPTYAYHDLAFAQEAAPDYYLTGTEQAPHFKSLGLENKHLGLGLILGTDGKKMRSRKSPDGNNATSAQELFQMVLDCLAPTPNPEKLAWNILAYQFNSTTVASTTKFDAHTWAKPEAPGMYITYTYARISNALKGTNPPKSTKPDPEDLELLGLCSYFPYVKNKAQQSLQPKEIALYTLTLAKKLSNLYKKKSIQEGSPSFLFAVSSALQTLEANMKLLGMHPLPKV